MGAPNHELIPAAILLDNPGITREEYAQLLRQTHFSCFNERRPNQPWQKPGPYHHETPNFHKGLYSLAEILHLPPPKEPLNIKYPDKDPQGFPIPRPEFISFSQRKNGEWVEPRFEVGIFAKTIVDGEEDIEESVFSPLEVGDIFYPWHGGYRGLVEKVYLTKKLNQNPKTDGIEDYEDHPTYRQKLRITKFGTYIKILRFATEKDLTAKFPQFAVDNLFDFSISSGILLHEGIWRQDKEPKLLWLKRDNKYYLDLDFFLSKSHEGEIENSYTNLILTAEAIRNKAWAFLSYCGFRHTNSFLRDFPEASRRYRQAAFDSFTSTGAAKSGLSNLEFLRFRIETGWHQRQDDPETLKRKQELYARLGRKEDEYYLSKWKKQPAKKTKQKNSDTPIHLEF